MSNLETAVAEAAADLIKKAEEAKGGKPTETVETPETPAGGEEEETTTGEEEETETTSEETQTEEELAEEQLAEAKKLYKALMDPNQRVAIIAELAQRTGILREPPETKQEVREAKKSIQDIIKEALPEFPGLADKLGTAIEKALEQERESHQEEMQQVHLTQLENQVSSSISRLRKQTGGESAKFEKRMADLSQQLIMGPDMTIDQYVASLYAVASAGSKTSVTKAQLADKIRKNANNAPDRLKSTTGPGSPGKFDKIPSKKMSLGESVNWAIQEAQKGRTRE